MADKNRRDLETTGTLLLGEIGEMDPTLQGILLQLLEDQSLPVRNSDQRVRPDLRIIVTTHHSLETLVADGRFREDLYYRKCSKFVRSAFA